MNKLFDTSHFIQEKTEISSPDAQITFGKKRKRKCFVPSAQCILLTGFYGSGRRKLAELLSQKLQMDIVSPSSISSQQNLSEICTGGTICILPPKAIQLPEIHRHLRDQGKVFYLMAEVLLMAHRQNLSEKQREVFAQEFVELEPLFMSSLDFILQAWKEPEELVDCVTESLHIECSSQSSTP